MNSNSRPSGFSKPTTGKPTTGKKKENGGQGKQHINQHAQSQAQHASRAAQAQAPPQAQSCGQRAPQAQAPPRAQRVIHPAKALFTANVTSSTVHTSNGSFPGTFIGLCEGYSFGIEFNNGNRYKCYVDHIDEQHGFVTHWVRQLNRGQDQDQPQETAEGDEPATSG